MLVERGRAIAIVSLTVLLIIIGLGSIIWQATIGFADKAGMYNVIELYDNIYLHFHSG